MFEANNQGTACDLKLGSYFHTFLLHFMRFSFGGNSFLMTLCSDGTVFLTLETDF